MKRVWPWLLLAMLLAACPDSGGGDDDDDNGDTTPPTILSTSPASQDTDIEVDAVVEVTFSEPMDPATINDSTVTLSVGGPTVDASVSYAGTTATLVPTAELDNGASYTGLVTLDATDLAGNHLATDETWSFSTVFFQVTSSALTEGGIFPDDNTCTGTDVSPPLTWPRAKDAQSYAIVMTDQSISLIHWAIWDIPAAVLSLPGAIERAPNPTAPAGAKQTTSYDNATFGYLGPCPQGNLHQYQFKVYAMGVAALPGVTTGSTRAQVEAAIIANTLDSATLTGNSDASP